MSTYGESVWDMGSVGHRTSDDVHRGVSAASGRVDGHADASDDGSDSLLAARALIARVDPQLRW